MWKVRDLRKEGRDCRVQVGRVKVGEVDTEDPS